MVAHAGHVLIDIALFAIPVGALAIAMLVANLRGRRAGGGRRQGSG